MVNIFKNNYHKITYFLLYISLILGFIFNENVTNGPFKDLQYTLKQVKIFTNDFLYSFLNYDKIEFPNRLSPVYISLLTLLKKIFIDLDILRFFLLHILILSQLYFYKCLKEINFFKFNFDKKILFIISTSIFLSPNFRANVIWIESSMFGLLFFLVSLYYFLKNYNSFKNKNVYFNIFFLAIAAYLRPSYCLFAIYFTYIYFFKFNNHINILKILSLNIILALPAFYYVFILDIFFIDFGGLSSNYYDKVAIISSIFIFHAFSFFFLMKEKISFRKINIIISVIFTSIIILNFDYNLSYAGGGIFLHLSNFLFNNNFLFFFLLPFFFYFIIFILEQNFKNNLVIILIIFLITPQYHLFHKYYDPLIYIICFTLLDFKFEIKNSNKFKFIFMYFGIIVFHYVTSFVNTYYLKF